jgi:hypothetical protein
LKPEHQVDGGGLARAIGAQQAEDFPAADMQIQGI